MKTESVSNQAKAWVTIAQQARKLLPSEIPSGQVQKTREDIAATLNVSRQTLRNYMAGLDFVDEVEKHDKEASRLLHTMSSPAVDVYSRWAKYDLPNVLEHIKGHKTEWRTVALVVAAEKSARLRALGKKEDRSLTDELKSLLAKMNNKRGARERWYDLSELDALLKLWFSAAVRSDLNWNTGESAGRSQHGISATGSFCASMSKDDRYYLMDRWDADHRISRGNLHPDLRMRLEFYSRAAFPYENPALEASNFFALIESPVYSIADHYRREARNLYTQAVAVAQLYPLVIVLFNDDAARQESLSVIKQKVPDFFGDDDRPHQDEPRYVYGDYRHQEQVRELRKHVRETVMCSRYRWFGNITLLSLDDFIDKESQ